MKLLDDMCDLTPAARAELRLAIQEIEEGMTFDVFDPVVSKDCLTIHIMIG